MCRPAACWAPTYSSTAIASASARDRPPSYSKPAARSKISLYEVIVAVCLGGESGKSVEPGLARGIGNEGFGAALNGFEAPSLDFLIDLAAADAEPFGGLCHRHS